MAIQVSGKSMSAPGGILRSLPQKGSLFLTLVVSLAVLSAGCGGSNPVPVQLLSISPTSATIGGSTQEVTVTGSNFTDRAEVLVDGTAATTTFVGNSELRFTLGAAALGAPGVLNIAVTDGRKNPTTTPAIPFTVVSTGVVSTTNHPQVAQYSMWAPRDAIIKVEFGLDTNYGRDTWTLPTPGGGGLVDILVAGMKSFSPYHMRAVVEFPDGTVHNDIDHTFNTGGLDPADHAAWTITQPAGQNPTGIQILNGRGRGGLGQLQMAIDLDGDIIWYPPDVWGATEFTPLENGLVFTRESGLAVDPTVRISRIREMDLAGNTIRQLTRNELDIALAAKGLPNVNSHFHHDAELIPNGQVVILTQVLQVFTDITGHEGTDVEVLGDGLIALDVNWEPIWTWSIFDHFHPNDLAAIFGANPPNQWDWSHGNGLGYSEADGSLLLSLRHNNLVLKIDYADGLGAGNVLWRLGPTDNGNGTLTLTNGTMAEFNYSQHFPTIFEDGMGVFQMGVWDNGVSRPRDDLGNLCTRADEAGCFSRAVIFEIDELMSTARIIWEDRSSPFAPIVGSFQNLPNGNVVWNAGSRSPEATGSIRGATVREVTRDTPPQTVWQLEVEAVENIIMFTSIRVPSLYPGVQW